MTLIDTVVLPGLGTAEICPPIELDVNCSSIAIAPNAIGHLAMLAGSFNELEMSELYAKAWKITQNPDSKKLDIEKLFTDFGRTLTWHD